MRNAHNSKLKIQNSKFKLLLLLHQIHYYRQVV